jgi:HlyD family secretion protein
MQQSAATVQAGAPLLVIGDPSRFEIVADVLSTDAVKITAGAPALIEQWGGEKALRAKVRLVEPYAFTKVSALGVEEKRVNVVIDPVDALGPLGDGYRVEARIVIWSADDVLKVPASAVFRVGDAWHAFAVEDGCAVQREVKVGRRNPDEVQILDGLAAGSRIVQYPPSDLVPGVRVRQKPGRRGV